METTRSCETRSKIEAVIRRIAKQPPNVRIEFTRMNAALLQFACENFARGKVLSLHSNS
jgi:hypothetical protein